MVLRLANFSKMTELRLSKSNMLASEFSFWKSHKNEKNALCQYQTNFSVLQVNLAFYLIILYSV